MKDIILAVILFSGVTQLLSAQTAVDEEAGSELDRLLEQALNLAADGDWNGALSALDQAELIDPDDVRIQSYRTSINDLKALDEGRELPVENESPDKDRDDQDTPKFVIERDEQGIRRDPGQFRDQFRGDLNLSLFVNDPVISRIRNTWSSFDVFIGSALGVDLRYWLPVLGRSPGFNFRSSGYSWMPSEPTLLFNTLDLGINLRGFLAESQSSRLEIGLDFGASLHSSKNLETHTVGNNFGLYLGLWIADPLLYHLFEVSGLENLVFSAGIRVHSTVGVQLIESVHYKVDIAWRFKNIHTGARLDWWGFNEANEQRTLLAFILFFGVHL